MKIQLSHSALIAMQMTQTGLDQVIGRHADIKSLNISLGEVVEFSSKHDVRVIALSGKFSYSVLGRPGPTGYFQEIDGGKFHAQAELLKGKNPDHTGRQFMLTVRLGEGFYRLSFRQDRIDPKDGEVLYSCTLFSKEGNCEF